MARPALWQHTPALTPAAALLSLPATAGRELPRCTLGYVWRVAVQDPGAGSTHGPAGSSPVFLQRRLRQTMT